MILSNKIKTIVLLIIIGVFGMSNNLYAQHKKVDLHPGYPPAFDSVKSHILVIIYDKESEVPPHIHNIFRGESDHITDLFPQFYTGDYNFVTMSKDIEDKSDYDNLDSIYCESRNKFTVINPAYKDVDKYRYILYFIEMTTFPNFGVYDRKTDKCYTAWSEDTGGGKWYIQGFAKRLEKVRAK